LTFLAELKSRRWWVAHSGQVQARSESETLSFSYPHPEQTLVEGKNLLLLPTSCWMILYHKGE
jgi:hypothetical protein